MGGASRPLGLTFPRSCVGGDFNVIRRRLEKLWGSRVTPSIRCFDEFTRESELIDPPLIMPLLLGQICKLSLFVKGLTDSCFK